ncbi:MULTISPECIES: hypothetical protein [unclassified Microcoleus]|nr:MULTISPECIES: hypothetical protein [unclassified Microcoleus]
MKSPIPVPIPKSPLIYFSAVYGRSRLGRSHPTPLEQIPNQY